LEEMEICKIDGCNNKEYSGGFCNKHYTRNLRYGNPLEVKNERHGMSNSPEYFTWKNMKARCYNPKNKYFYRYGTRNIVVCDRWKNSFNNFLEDMGEKPFPKAEIDRINNDEGYEPNNCHWVTSAENCHNRSDTKLDWDKVGKMRAMYKDGKLSLRGLSKVFNISHSVIGKIINNQSWVINE